MSSCSSEVDVIKTRLSTCDDDNGVLYAYEPNTAYVNQSVLSDTPCEEQPKTIVDVLSHCKVIQDAIQNLDKKFDVIKGKVSKIYRFRSKLIWQNRRPLGYAYKHYTYLLSRKIKLQKTKKKDVPIPVPLSHSESYSPTTPARRSSDNSQSNPVETYHHSQDSLIQDPYQSQGSPFQPPESFYENREMRLSQSPIFPPVYTQSYPSYYTSNDPVQRSPSMPCFGSPGAHSTTGVFPPSQTSTSVPAAVPDQGKSSPAHNPEMMAYPALLENGSLGHTDSSVCAPTGLAASPSVGTEPCMLKQDLPDDPSTWSVEEVILFLNQTDPQTLAPLADIFRQHDIDGSALLLLPSDIMIKYMGIKLGTALKLCHYIEKLKVEKGING
ncbi:sex comb on midleg-like protein 1 isoform 2-T2 [Molossus nigricans]